jgi:hypothetical protein
MSRARKISLYQEVADSLNKKGIKPFSAREWKATNIQSIVYGKIKNDQVMAEVHRIFRKNNVQLKCKDS